MTEIEKNLSGLAERVNAEHRACETAANAALDHAMSAGDLLSEAKAKLPHGAFGAWLEENFAGSDRTARAYMRVARHREELEAKRQGSATLSLDRALKAIAAPSGETLANRLQELERQLAGVIEQHPARPPATALAAGGRILLEIEANGLHRAAGYAAFSQYCSERFGLSRRSRDAAILQAELADVIPAFDTDEKAVDIPEGTSDEKLVRAWKIMDALEELAVR